jgi:hypothetical protein
MYTDLTQWTRIRRRVLDGGVSLADIRDGKLYRGQGYSTFEDYCQQRWGFSRDRLSC